MQMKPPLPPYTAGQLQRLDALADEGLQLGGDEPSLVAAQALLLHREVAAVAAGRLGQQDIQHALVADGPDRVGSGRDQVEGAAAAQAFVRAVHVDVGDPAVAEALEVGRAHADLDRLVALEQAVGEAAARLDGAALGHVVTDEAGQQFDQVAREAAEEALDVRLVPGLERGAQRLLDVQTGHHAGDVLAGVVAAVVGFHFLGHAPIEHGLAHQGGHGCGLAGLADQQLGPA
jgi:hypothetical protein